MDILLAILSLLGYINVSTDLLKIRDNGSEISLPPSLRSFTGPEYGQEALILGNKLISSWMSLAITGKKEKVLLTVGQDNAWQIPLLMECHLPLPPWQKFVYITYFTRVRCQAIITTSFKTIHGLFLIFLHCNKIIYFFPHFFWLVYVRHKVLKTIIPFADANERGQFVSISLI